MNENEEVMTEEELDTEDFVETEDDDLSGNVEEVEQDEDESLDSLESEDNQDAPEQTQAPSEPGWIKGRIDKAVRKAVAETEARMQAMFDQQMEPFRAKAREDEAQALLSSRKVADIETARELVNYRHGFSTESQQKAQPQPRNEQGQFAPKEDPVMMTRIDMLAHQADTIKDNTGIDLVPVLQNDEKVRDAIMNGEMDFYDLAAQMNNQRQKRPPAPMRSPNGASGQQHNAINTMSDEAFDRMEKRIKEGARYALK